jgi:quercetin dioxygenase-like cupin family protein
VLEGEVTCLLEEGEVTVRAGDVLVQRATPHGWINRGDVPFVSIAVMVDVGIE